jgi:hypothetical protein
MILKNNSFETITEWIAEPTALIFCILSSDLWRKEPFQHLFPARKEDGIG